MGKKAIITIIAAWGLLCLSAGVAFAGIRLSNPDPNQANNTDQSTENQTQEEQPESKTSEPIEKDYSNTKILGVVEQYERGKIWNGSYMISLDTLREFAQHCAVKGKDNNYLWGILTKENSELVKELTDLAASVSESRDKRLFILSQQVDGEHVLVYSTVEMSKLKQIQLLNTQKADGGTQLLNDTQYCLELDSSTAYLVSKQDGYVFQIAYKPTGTYTFETIMGASRQIEKIKAINPDEIEFLTKLSILALANRVYCDGIRKDLQNNMLNLDGIQAACADCQGKKTLGCELCDENGQVAMGDAYDDQVLFQLFYLKNIGAFKRIYGNSLGPVGSRHLLQNNAELSKQYERFKVIKIKCPHCNGTKIVPCECLLLADLVYLPESLKDYARRRY